MINQQPVITLHVAVENDNKVDDLYDPPYADDYNELEQFLNENLCNK